MYIGMAINFFLIDDWIIIDYFDDKRIVARAITFIDDSLRVYCQ